MILKSIRGKLIVPTVAVVLVCGIAIGYFSYQNSRSAVNAIADDLRLQMSRRVLDHLEGFLSTPEQLLRDNAEAIRQGTLDATDPVVLQRHFLRQNQAYGTVTSLYFGNTAGGHEGSDGSLYVISTKDFRAGPFTKYLANSDGDRISKSLELPDFDARTRDWYRRALSSNDVAWGEAYVLFTGQDMAIAPSRVVKGVDGTVLGVLGSDIFLSEITGFLRELHRDSYGMTFIMEPSGLLVASSTGERPFKMNADGRAGTRLRASDLKNPIIAESAARIFKRFSGVNALKEHASLHERIGSEPSFVEVSPFREPGGLFWLVVTVVPESAYMGQVIAGDRRNFWLFTGALALMVLVAGLVTRGITRPILALTSVSEDISRGNLSARLDLDRGDEVGVLAKSFNHMVEQLKASFDVRDRQLVEIRDAEQRYRTLAEISPVAVFRTDADGQCVYVNDQWCKFSGLSSGQALGDGWAQAIHPEDRDRVFAEWRRAAQEGEVFASECRFRSPDGRVTWLFAQSSSERRLDGNIVGYVGAATDITDRKLVEDALQVERDRAETYLEISEALIVELDGDGQVTLINPHACAVLGYAQAELAGANWFETVIPPAEREGTKDTFRALIAGKTAQVEYYENDVVTKGGENRRIFWHNSLVRDDTGGIIGTLSSGQDITDRKRAEEALLQAQKMEAVGQLTGGVAHDFNNLLSVVMGNAGIIAARVRQDETAKQCVETILGAAKRGASLSQRLLAFSRQQPLSPKPTDIAAAVHGVEDMLGRTLGEHIDLNIDIGEDLWPAMIDGSQLDHALVNLALNAGHAMPDGGTLTIRTANVTLDEAFARKYQEVLPGDYVQVALCDTGLGMTTDVLERACEPFFTTKDVGEGSGLGLSMVYGFAKQSGGHFTIESEVGQGTTVTLYLPRAPRSVEKVTVDQTEPAHSSGRPARVLVVEDDPDVRLIPVTVLRGEGYDVVEAATPQEALSLFAAGEIFDVLFTDVVLPEGMNGVALAKKARQVQPDIRLVYTTGYSADAVIKDENLDDDVILLNKPYEIAELVSAMRGILDGEDS